MPTLPADHESTRIVISETPFPSGIPATLASEAAPWPAKWIAPDADTTPPCVVAYRLVWQQPEPATVRLHVSADERYELWLNGRLLGRGPERCLPARWAFETHEVVLAAGENRLAARVWTLGRPHRPSAQFSVGHGFFLAPEPAELRDRLGTGFAPWEARVLSNREFLPKRAAFGTSAFERVRGGDVEWRTGGGSGWSAARVLGEVRNATGTFTGSNERRIVPAELPSMIDRPIAGGSVRHVGTFEDFETRFREPLSAAGECVGETPAWNALWRESRPVTVPPHTRRRVILDLDDYYCAYPELRLRNGRGARLALHWEEALYAQPVDRHAGGPIRKGHRDLVTDRFSCGFGEEFLPAGHGEVETFDTLWWRCGRFVELAVATAEEPLTLLGLTLRETRYPWFPEATFASDDAGLLAALPLCERGQAMCAHETFFDCPYYEQLQYLADVAIQALIVMATSRDARLVRRLLHCAHETRHPDGMTVANLSPGGMMLPSFGFYWITALRDYLWWRGDGTTLPRLLPGARAIVDFWLKQGRRDGLVISPPGWNFLDWMDEPGWHTGAPPGGLPGQVSAALNWMIVWTLGHLAALEDLAGEPELAARWRRLAGEIHAALDRTCWREERGLYADAPELDTFSQHQHVFALLSERLEPDRRSRVGRALADGSLAPSTVSFSHYLLDALYRAGEVDAFQRRLEEWRQMPALGFRTPPVRGVRPHVHPRDDADPSRSDCHAWGSHPLYHVAASVLGVRPAAPGFARVRVAPLIAPGSWARGTVPHPLGTIRVDLRRSTAGAWSGEIELPEGLTGEFVAATRPAESLHPGRNVLI